MKLSIALEKNLLIFSIFLSVCVLSFSGAAAVENYGLSVGARVFQIYGKCTLLDCKTMKYLVEVANVYENRDNLSNTEVSVLSICSASILTLGESYKMNLLKVGKIYQNIGEPANSNVDLFNERRIKNCEYKIISFKKE